MILPMYPTGYGDSPYQSMAVKDRFGGRPWHEWAEDIRYRWDYNADTGYAWWIERMAHCFNMYNVVRIDHFRGFDEYYAIPFGEDTAQNGHWEKGPGINLFRAIERAIGWKQVIAEDLGYVTDSVKHLVWESYTGTHDNETLIGWWNIIDEKERNMARDYMCDYYTPCYEIHKPIIAMVMRSRSNLCVIPIQDYLGLDNKARMNTPSTVGKNWKWRVQKKQRSENLKRYIRDTTIRYGRCNC